MKFTLFGLLIFVGLGGFSSAQVQASYDITADQPAIVSGIEYGYAIRNESKKTSETKSLSAGMTSRST